MCRRGARGGGWVFLAKIATSTLHLANLATSTIDRAEAEGSETSLVCPNENIEKCYVAETLRAWSEQAREKTKTRCKPRLRVMSSLFRVSARPLLASLRRTFSKSSVVATARLIDGRQIANDVLVDVSARVESATQKYGRPPVLSVVLVGDRGDSARYD